LRTGTLRSLTDGWWAHLTRPFANWPAGDVVWAVDHLPGGAQHRTRSANVGHPAGWLRWRLAHWLRPDGTALPSPSETRVAAAERHRTYLERRNRELGLPRRTAAIRATPGYKYESAVPAPAPAWTPPTTAHYSPGLRLAGWAAHRTARPEAPRPATHPARQPEWWTEVVAAAAAAVAVEESAVS
jgi:hypothetical protein